MWWEIECYRYWNPDLGFNIGMGMKWLVWGNLLREKPVHSTVFRMSSTEDGWRAMKVSTLNLPSEWLDFPGYLTWIWGLLGVEGCAEGKSTVGGADRCVTAGPGTLEMLGKHLLTDRTRLQMVLNLWEQMTFPGSTRVKIREAVTSLAVLEVKNKCSEFKNSFSLWKPDR